MYVQILVQIFIIKDILKRKTMFTEFLYGL